MSVRASTRNNPTGARLRVCPDATGAHRSLKRGGIPEGATDGSSRRGGNVRESAPLGARDRRKYTRRTSDVRGYVGRLPAEPTFPCRSIRYGREPLSGTPRVRRGHGGFTVLRPKQRQPQRGCPKAPRSIPFSAGERLQLSILALYFALLPTVIVLNPRNPIVAAYEPMPTWTETLNDVTPEPAIYGPPVMVKRWAWCHPAEWSDYRSVTVWLEAAGNYSVQFDAQPWAPEWYLRNPRR